MKYQILVPSLALIAACTKPAIVTPAAATPKPEERWKSVISIEEKDLICKIDEDCARIKTNCGCSYGVPVNTASFEKYQAERQKACAGNELMCKMVAPPDQVKCVKQKCALVAIEAGAND